MDVNEWAKEVHELAKEKGWWDEPRTLGDIIALCHSEISEAYESYRKGDSLFFTVAGKPEGISTELVDCIIRIFDYLYYRGVNVEEVLKAKHEYNKTRSYRHGGKLA